MTPPRKHYQGRPRPDWVVKAACRAPGVQFDDFYPVPNNDPKAATQRAKSVCAPCPVRSECREWGDLISPDDGIFGGLTSGERQSRRSLGRAA